MTDRGVFVFAEDGIQFFATVEEAAAYVEAVDMNYGAYEALSGSMASASYHERSRRPASVWIAQGTAIGRV
jgi:hypothetical protein